MENRNSLKGQSSKPDVPKVQKERCKRIHQSDLSDTFDGNVRFQSPSKKKRLSNDSLALSQESKVPNEKIGQESLLEYLSESSEESETSELEFDTSCTSEETDVPSIITGSSKKIILKDSLDSFKESDTSVIERMKIAQFYYNYSCVPKKASEVLKEVDVNYCIPLSHKQGMIDEWPGYTSLHFAVMKMDLDLTNDLLKQGADPIRQGTKNAFTPLHIVINETLKRKPFCTKIMSDEELKNYRDKNFQERSLIDALLLKQLETNNTLNPKNKYGMSHLHIACIVNHAEAVEFFAKAKDSLNQSIDNDYYYENLDGYTALHCAIKYSSVKATFILLQHGADIRIQNAKGQSCLDLLIERVIDINDFITIEKSKFHIPCAKEIERIEITIRLLLKTRTSSETFVDDMGFSAIHLACLLTDESVVKDFLKPNIDVNMAVKNKSKFWPGWTPLHFAACCKIENVILLMQSGADITIENSKGETVLDLCAKRFTPIDIRLILSTKNEFKDIVLSDNHTKLLDLLSIMNDFNKFRDFLLRLKDADLIIPFNSPVWPGYNLLHLCVHLCREGEETSYRRKIELCLEHGCSASMENFERETPVHLAFRMQRETKIVEKLLSCCEENAVDRNDLSHLHIACALGQLDSVKRYLSSGVNVNSRVRTSFNRHKNDWTVLENSTPLHVAVAFGHKHVVEYLLKNKADVYARDSLGFTPIHVLMFSPRSEWDNSLTRLVFESTSNLYDSVSEAGLSLLHVAAHANNAKAVKKLLRKGAEVDSVIDVDVKQPASLVRYAGRTPFEMASGFAEEAIEALMRGGANPNDKISRQFSELEEAIIDEFDDLSDDRYLPFWPRMLKSGKCNGKGSGISLLHFACIICDFKWAKKLLKGGADVNARIDAKIECQGATPLHSLLQPFVNLGRHNFFMVSFVKLLLKNEADVTIADCYGYTPIHLMHEVLPRDDFFCSDDEDNDWLFLDEYPYEVIDLMLESQRSYNVNPVDKRGFSHFHFACIRNNVKTVKKFLSNGINVNHSVDPFAGKIGGFTPLHFALAYRSREVAYLLLEKGADLNAVDVQGNTPLHVALKRKFVDLALIKTMISKGADIHVKNLKEETLLYCLSNSGASTPEATVLFLDGGCYRDFSSPKI